MKTSIWSTSRLAAAILFLSFQNASSLAQFASITGTLTYSGRQIGDVWVTANVFSNLVSTNYSVRITPTESAAFTNVAFSISGLPSPGTYYLFAWRDSNGNGINDTAEAHDWFPENPIDLTADAAIGKISLADSDADGDLLPDWWEAQYGLDPATPNCSRSIGRGFDGDLVVPAGSTSTINMIATKVAGSNPAGTKLLTVSATNGFRTNDLILTVVVRDPNPSTNLNQAGCYELNRVISLSSNALGLFQPLTATYSATNGEVIQIVKVPEYGSVTVNGTLTCPSWNGSNGGVLTFLCQNDLNIADAGTIDAGNRGYRGGLGVLSANTFEFGTSGEGSNGWSTNRATTTAPYPQGGGGAGKGADASGGGGGYGIAGNNGDRWDGSSSFGVGAPSFGGSNLTQLFFGGGGGGSGSHSANRPGVAGGTGGGIVFIAANTATGSGSITSSGADGSRGVMNTTDGNCGAGGGGGAGGSISVSGFFSSNILISVAGGTGGASAVASLGKNGGAGGNGRIRVFPSQPNPWLSSYTDTDADGLDDGSEYWLGTNPMSSDSDQDGMPDGWETKYGLNPTNAADAAIIKPSDHLTNLQKYRYGLIPLITDTEGDHLDDYDELFVYGTDPLTPDTDGDGMPDRWEVDSGLNPTVNDANLDRDLDGLTNWQEYNFTTNNTLSPSNRFSSTNGLSDHETVTGTRKVQYFYDRDDRLVGAQHGNGLVLCYQYDGNGNILRQLTTIQDSSAIPLVWRQVNGLTNNTGSQSDFSDADGDGWSNFQEWRADSNPTNRDFTPVTSAATLLWPFAVSNLVMGTGQLDSQGTPDAIVIGAEPTVYGVTNRIWILRQEPTGWRSEAIEIGDVAVKSLAIGLATNRARASLFVGVTQPNGHTALLELTNATTGWRTTVHFEAWGDSFNVVGVLPNGRLLSEFAPYSDGNKMLHECWSEGSNWLRRVLDPLPSGQTGNVIVKNNVLSSAPYVCRRVESNSLSVVSSHNLVLDDFKDGVINSNLWSTSGTSSGYAGWAVAEQNERLELNAHVDYTYSGGGNSAIAQVACRDLWQGSLHNAAYVKISEMRCDGGVFWNNLGAFCLHREAAVRWNGNDIYRFTSDMCSPRTDVVSPLILHLVKLNALTYGRYQTNNSVWSSWILLGPESGVLDFTCSVNTGINRVGGATTLLVDKVLFTSVDALSDRLGSGDFQSTNSLYLEAAGAWELRYESANSWREGVRWANTYGGDLVKIGSSNENQRLRNYMNSEFWMGLYWDALKKRWSWLDGSPMVYSNWGVGEPSLVQDNAAVYMRTDGLWAVSTNSVLRPAVMRTAFRWNGSLVTNVIPDDQLPLARSELAACMFDANETNRVFVMTAAIKDVHPNGQLSNGGSLATRVFESGPDHSSEWAAQTIALDVNNYVAIAAIAHVNLTNGPTGVFFSGAPDGKIYRWTQLSSNASFSPTLFSDFHKGCSWHALAAHRGIAAGHGLAGLRVDPAYSNRCDLIYWPAETVMPETQILQQTAPLARILPEPKNGYSLAPVDIRVWDAEGNGANVELQVSLAGTNQWTNASIISIDARTQTRVQTSPGGLTHRVIWNATLTVGPGVRTNVLLRARARDITLTGEWSSAVLYFVDTASDSDNDGLPDQWEQNIFGTLERDGSGDYDNDGFSDYAEYVAGTDPTNPLSNIRVTALERVSNGWLVEWRGGTNTQILQRRFDFGRTNESWVDIHTNPTPFSGSYTDLVTTNLMFYRIRTEK